MPGSGNRGSSDGWDASPKDGRPTGEWGGKGAPWGGKAWRGKGASPYGPPWSGSGDAYRDAVTVVIDRRTAENVYYALAIALGSVDWPESGGGWSGPPPKGYGKGGKTPPDGGWPADTWAADPWPDQGPKNGGKGRRPATGPVTTPTPVGITVKIPAAVALSPNAIRPSVAAVAVKPTTVAPTTIRPTTVRPATVKPTAVANIKAKLSAVNTRRAKTRPKSKPSKGAAKRRR